MRVILAIVVGAAFVAPAFSQVTPQKGDWPMYGRDAGGTRYSPLTQISTANVSDLQRAWTYHTGETGPSLETTPIFINDVLYFSTQNQNIVALNPETGKEIWKHDTKSNTRESRGVAYWPGDKQTPPRILFGTGDGRLIALDAKTGELVPGFGDNGTVDLHTGVADKFPKAIYSISSPPTIYRNVVIVGPSTQEGGSNGPSGDPRGFDVRTGKLLWTFHTVPRPGEPGNDTWGPNGWKDRSGPSQWGPGTVDLKLGLVYLPVGNAADGYYGADRPGNNLYSNSLIALDALTGKLRWSRQIVHHDLWDYDMSAPPALVEAKRDGKIIPALAQTTKQGLLFILDRRTGEPVFGIEERPVAKGDTPGEWYSPTEPFPVKPVPLARNTMTQNDVTTRTPEAHQFCGDWLSKLRFQGPFTPFGLTASLSMPGSMGGGNWGGVSFDPTLGYIFVNTSSLGGTGHMVPSAPGAALAYHNQGGYQRFIDQQGYPCQQPPWGELSAVNANTGEVVWRKPLGSYDELEAQGLKNTGATNMGGSIVTAGGLVFIAATTDSKFRAFDSRDGKEVWVTKLDASGTTVPMTYQGSDGKQYVLVAAGGTNRFRMVAHTAGQTSDSLIAFALSDKPKSEAAIPSTPSQGATSASTTTESRLIQTAPLPADGMPEGDGKATVLAVCTKCHGASNFTTIRMDHTGWANEVKAMRDNGAVGTEEDFKKITDYLTKNFPQ